MTFERKIAAEDDTTEWFNWCDIDGNSPFAYVEYVANEFCSFLNKKGYTLDVPQHQFLYDLCTATCTMYYYQVWQKNKFIVGAPKRKFTRPKQWTPALEGQWKDYLHSRIVNYEFWEQFWRKLPCAYWESVLERDNWRDVMQTLLPFYIRREVDILLEEEIVCQEDNGNIVTWDDHEAEEEPDIRDMDGSKKKKSK